MAHSLCRGERHGHLMELVSRNVRVQVMEFLLSPACPTRLSYRHIIHLKDNTLCKIHKTVHDLLSVDAPPLLLLLS